MKKFVNFLSENLKLEGVLYAPENKGNFPAAIVLHPHPQFGGNMYNNVVDAVCEKLENSIIALKFNCRGVGRSEGHSSGGKEEGRDVEAAIEFLKKNKIVDQKRIAFIGYSWGTYVGLPVTYKNPNIKILTGIACPVGLWSYDYLKDCEKPILLVSGTYDQFAPRDKIEKLFEGLSESKELKELFFLETNHFYIGQEKNLAAKVSEFVKRLL